MILKGASRDIKDNKGRTPLDLVTVRHAGNAISITDELELK